MLEQNLEEKVGFLDRLARHIQKAAREVYTALLAGSLSLVIYAGCQEKPAGGNNNPPLQTITCYQDKDGDRCGVENEQIGVKEDENCPEGYVSYINREIIFDCDDGNINIHPGAPEGCNNIDDDCNGIIDGDLTRSCSSSCGEGTEVCKEGNWQNCDARLPTEEICDEIDNDCDSHIDGSLEKIINCGLNNQGEQRQICEGGQYTNSGGCIDSDECILNQSREFYTGPPETAGVGECKKGIETCLGYPARWQVTEREIILLDEECDGKDNDCDGQTDEGLIFNDWYLDNEGDGYGSNSSKVVHCQRPGEKYTLFGGDCDDSNPNIHPDAPELCDGIDNNCRDGVDEGFVLGEVCEVGVGECKRQGVYTCSASGLETICNGVPGQPRQEICNDLDDNCDGQIDNIQMYSLIIPSTNEGKPYDPAWSPDGNFPKFPAF